MNAKLSQIRKHTLQCLGNSLYMKVVTHIFLYPQPERVQNVNVNAVNFAYCAVSRAIVTDTKQVILQRNTLDSINTQNRRRIRRN